MSAKLRYSRTATIKLWRQHLGAQLPGTLPQLLKTGGTKNNVLVTKPSERFQDTRVILNFFNEIWEEKSQNSTSGCLTRATKGLRSKKKSYSPIYIVLNDSKHFSRHNSAAKNDQAMGLLRSGKAQIPTCNALDAAIAPTCRGTT